MTTVYGDTNAVGDNCTKIETTAYDPSWSCQQGIALSSCELSYCHICTMLGTGHRYQPSSGCAPAGLTGCLPSVLPPQWVAHVSPVSVSLVQSGQMVFGYHAFLGVPGE